MDEPRTDVDADNSDATLPNEVTDRVTALAEVEYSPISGWFLVAVGLVMAGFVAWIVSDDRRRDSYEPPRAVRLAIDVNRATIEELQILPRIGPALAGRIVEYARQHGPVTNLEQLLEIRGLGPRMIKELAPYLIFPAMPGAETVAVHELSKPVVGGHE